MTILFFGDIIGRPGREAIKKILPLWQEQYEPDLVIANCENIAHGKGITQETILELQSSGVNAFTSGNHIFKNKSGIPLLDQKEFNILRPANYPPGVPGQGYRVFSVGSRKVGVINLVGRVFLREDFDCPFRTADAILAEWGKEGIQNIIIDFHAEANSETAALGWYLDGRVSLVAGTHTHVQTADSRLLSKGTAYISDIGMVGVRDSVIGFDRESVLKNFLTQMPLEPVLAEGDALVSAILLKLDPKNGKAIKITPLQEIVKL